MQTIVGCQHTWRSEQPENQSCGAHAERQPSDRNQEPVPHVLTFFANRT
jgi:hypothetical protein